MKKKCAEILLHYRELFIKGDIIIGEWGIFGVDIFFCYSEFFIKGNFVIGRVESMRFTLAGNKTHQMALNMMLSQSGVKA